MEGTIIDIYKKKPGNYLLIGEGGSGKSTQLRMFKNELLGKEIYIKGKIKTIIPIYQKMVEVNRNIGCVNSFDYFMFDLVNHYFPNANSEQIMQLLKALDYQFVFILDGANELIDYTEGYASVYVHLCNGIKELIDDYSDSVNIIISTRCINGEDPMPFGYGIKHEIYESFRVCKLNALKMEQIKTYVGDEYNITNAVLLANPMLLSMYKVIIETNRQFNFADKNELICEFFKVQIDSKKMQKRYVDTNYEELKIVYESLLPYIGYILQYAFLAHDYLSAEDSLEELISDYADAYGRFRNKNEKEIYIKKFKHMILEQHVIDDSLIFSHQMFMEYFASKGLAELDVHNKKFFIENLTQELYYDSEKNVAELDRRTRYLGLAESIISEVGDSLDVLIQDQDITQAFYQETAGVYEDLKKPYAERASRLAWISYRCLIGRKSDYETMRKKNTLFYCMMKDVKETLEYNDVTYTVDSVAKELADYVYSHEPENKEKSLFSKILNNIGALYFARKDYENAYIWHKKTLEFRQKYKIDLLASSRALMGDIFHLYRMGIGEHSIKDAYHYYLLGLKSLADKNNSEIDMVYQNGIVPVDFAERGLGIILLVIKDLGEYDLLEEAYILSKYVFEKSTKDLARTDVNNLNNLREKLKDFIALDISEKCRDSFREILREIDRLI